MFNSLENIEKQDRQGELKKLDISMNTTTKEKTRSKKPKATKSTLKAVKIESNIPKDQRFKERWSQLNSDVHSALSHWNNLTEKYSGKISRDEEQLKEIKLLLKDLQKKLKVFND